ncbi:ArsR family transcriptional regulator [Thermococcus stetteri]|uniref:ArsR family transcriptional regulator n=1 Tax=Thermococcus stetteri TaxID=49900 RepID=UPI001AE49EAE|nr:ArsR family transcriptional regulator [Thermococcus stetteri]MBP1911289.1 Mn-dependent DtxR family transcriptional regulator [Thermococcus stetteri]
MFGRRKDVVYKVLSTKKRAVALHKLSAELETPAPALLKTVRELESEGLVEVFYGVDKASIMVRAKTLEDYFSSEV